MQVMHKTKSIIKYQAQINKKSNVQINDSNKTITKVHFTGF